MDSVSTMLTVLCSCVLRLCLRDERDSIVLLLPLHITRPGADSDGPEIHSDYYNSLVIQPMLLDILKQAGDEYPEWAAMRAPVLKRAIRHAEVLERSISPEGTFPPLGRSLAYRCGAMQHLAQMALQRDLPVCVTPAQVRCALTAVIRRSLGCEGTFDEAGWLRVGFAGAQPEIGEMYISTGSLYLATGACAYRSLLAAAAVPARILS